MALNLPFLTKNSPRGNPKPRSINDFISQVKSGAMARQNRFVVLFTPLKKGNLSQWFSNRSS